MKKIIIEIEYDEKRFEDEEDEQDFLNSLQHDIDSVCIEFTETATSKIIKC